MELDADNLADRDILMCVSQHARLDIAAEYLNLIAVANAAEQVSSVGRDVELARMSACGLIADASEQSRCLVDGEDGDAFVLQAVA